MRIPGPEGQPYSQEYSSDDQAALRMVWLVFAGWWLAILWVVIAWLCVLIVPLAPHGLRMLAGISRVTGLRSPGLECTYILHTTLRQMEQKNKAQRLKKTVSPCRCEFRSILYTSAYRSKCR